jgi:flagellar L-ring protein precursor FlgH
MLKRVFLILLLTQLGACYHLLDRKVDMPEKTTAKPVSPTPPDVATGSIFADRGQFRPLFEDRRPRQVGDIVTINLAERTTASQTTNSKAERTSSLSFPLPTITGLAGNLLGNNIKQLSATGSDSNKFEGKGTSNNNNLFNGTITTTVIEVLANGNLSVSGEKQIGTNGEVQTLRFSGVISPTTILSGNVVSSTQVADARLEYFGRGQLDDTQRMGWLQRFFSNFLPF